MTDRQTLLAFDFDGTLAPICEDPAEVRLNRGATELLREATQLRGVAVAIMSGRDADDVAARVAVPSVYVIGSHGLEIRAPGGVTVLDAPRMRIDLDPELRADIERSRIRLEHKKHAIALHWRGIELNGERSIVDRFAGWASGSGLDLIEGRCVIEARQRGWQKDDALRWLTSATGALRVIYAGDDLTDFAALRFAAEHGRAIFVANDERQPPSGTTVVSSSGALLRVIRQDLMI